MFDSNLEAVFQNNLIFIDSQISNYQDLVAGVNDAEVVVIDRHQDGIEHITTTLSQYQNISSVQIISHGMEGQLNLGTTDLSLENINDYEHHLQEWSQYLTNDADILLFGCNVGTDLEFLDSLSKLTSADIAASEDLTGNAELNGDWELEISLGEISSELEIDLDTLENYQSVLEVSRSQLVLELDFETGAIDSAPDGNNNNGRLVNGALLGESEQPFGGVVEFDEGNQYLAIANSDEINLTNSATRTVSLWFKPEDIDAANPQIIYEDGGTTRGFNIYLEGGQLYVGGWNLIESNWSGTFLSSDRLSSDTWHHVALVLDAQPAATTVQPEVLFAYLDGVEIGRGAGSQVWRRTGGVAFGGLNSGTKLHTGNVNGSGVLGFSGTIDEARIYNRALSDTEISTLADFNLDEAEPPQANLPVARLELDETSGNLATDSQKNNDGTLRNGAFFEPVGADLGGGVRFDGNDDYVALANSFDINLGTHSQRTISLWFNADNIDTPNPQVLFEAGATVRGLNIYIEEGQLYFGGWNLPESNWFGTFLSSDRLSSDTWHHVALVLDAQPEVTTVQPDVLFAYLDGVEIGRGLGSQLWQHSGGIGLGGVLGATKFHDGNLNGSGVAGFAGNIASLEIYNQALNGEAIALLSSLDVPTPPVVVDPPSSPQKYRADNQNFNYDGRIDWQDPQAPALGFAGTSVEFKFTGTSLAIELSEDNWGRENYVDVYLDGNPQPITIKLRREGGNPVVYDIVQGLENKVHNAVIYKRNDYSTGEFNFHGAIVDGQLLEANPDSQRTIEIYGDSITSGIAVEFPQTGVQDPQGNTDEISNAYYSYGSILARDYDAEVSLVAQSGVSLVNGFGYWNNFWNNGTGGEAIYDKVKPLHNAPTWDFNNYDADLVILAYGQNDSSTVGNNLSKEQWKERYKQMLANIRAKHPDAYFIGMFPAMFHNRQWDSYITEAIAEYRTEYNDERVFSLIHQQLTPGHPRISEQEVMADTLKDFIDSTLVENGFSW